MSSAIKADSVLRQQWPRGMYSKVSLATGLDAGEAVLHRGRAQWGHRTCMYCTLHAGGGACHNHRGSTPRKTAKLRLHQNQRATNHQELTIRTYRGPLVQNRKTHTPGWKVKQAESLRRVHTAESGTGAASKAYLPNGDPVSWVKGRSTPSLLGDPVSWTAVGLGVVGTAACRHGYRGQRAPALQL